MKTLKCFLVLFAFVGITFVGCSDESQSPVSSIQKGSLEKNIIHNFTMTDYPIPLELYPWPVDPGVIKYLPNGNIQYKKRGILEVITSDDPLLAGIMEHYLSTMIDGETGNGAVHGSFTTTPNDPTVGGVWEGTYVGYRSYVGYQEVDFPFGPPDGEYYIWTLPLKLEAHGKGGLIDKMQMFMTATLTIYGAYANYPEPMFWMGNGSGFYK